MTNRILTNYSRKTTVLKEEEINKVKTLVMQYLKDNDCITNSKLRKLSGINYDQAIYFFKEMINQNMLNRLGNGSGTYYTPKNK